MRPLYGDPRGKGRRLNALSAGDGSGTSAEARTVWAMPDHDPSASQPVTVRDYYHGSSVNSNQRACLTEKYPGEHEGERLVPSKSAAKRPNFSSFPDRPAGRAHFWVCDANPCEKGGVLRFSEGAVWGKRFRREGCRKRENASATIPRPTMREGQRAHLYVAGANVCEGRETGRGGGTRNQGFCLTKTRGDTPEPREGRARKRRAGKPGPTVREG